MFVKAFVRRVDYSLEHLEPDASWESSFVIAECDESNLVEQLAVIALGHWKHGVLSTVDVFCCDLEGIVEPGASPLPFDMSLADAKFPTFPQCVCVVSRPSFDVDDKKVQAAYALLREFTLSRCRRAEKEAAKTRKTHLAEIQRKREENLKQIEVRRQQHYVKSVLAAHTKEEERLMRIKAQRCDSL
jgi:hypothetical protein